MKYLILMPFRNPSDKITRDCKHISDEFNLLACWSFRRLSCISHSQNNVIHPTVNDYSNFRRGDKIAERRDGKHSLACSRTLPLLGNHLRRSLAIFPRNDDNIFMRLVDAWVTQRTDRDRSRSHGPSLARSSNKSRNNKSGRGGHPLYEVLIVGDDAPFAKAGVA